MRMMFSFYKIVLNAWIKISFIFLNQEGKIKFLF